MVGKSAFEITTVGEVDGLVRRILDGEVVVLRRGLQQLGLYDMMAEATLDGIRAAAGAEIAANVRQSGFDRIHEWVEPGAIPAVTDAVYTSMAAISPPVLGKIVARLFPDGGAYYFERSPNVRFHIPYDRAARHRREFAKFAEGKGEGKITAHGPHRDSWVDCPDNAINVWIALGPVLRGNGLTVFADDYRTEFTFRDGYIESGQKIHQPLTFDLQPGDAVLFHSNHLHGSELNRTDSTRYVVSYRITFGRPHYPHGHYHHYLHGGLAASRFRWLAGVPQNLQMSFVAQQVRRVRHKVTGRGKMSGTDGSRTSAHSGQESIEEGDSIALAGFQVGSIRPVSKAVCIARLAETKFAAVSRRCPHMGGDLADGWVDDEQQIVCPWHSMSFDPHTGASRCNVLPPLRVFSWDVRGDRVHVDVDRVSESAPSRDRP